MGLSEFARPLLTWWNDNLYNAAASQQGWFSNAYMGKMTLYHSNY